MRNRGMIPDWARDFFFVQTRAYPLWRLPETPVNWDRGLFPEESGRAVKLTTHFNLVQRLIIREALRTFRMYLHGQTTSP